MNFVIVSTKPARPREGMPCNGCGYCCTQEICGIGRIAFPDAVAPCPGLRERPEGMRCALVETEIATGMEPLLQNALGIGRGCCAS
jgi:hypothetical protein